MGFDCTGMLGTLSDYLIVLPLQVCTKGKLHIFKYLSATAHEQEKVHSKFAHSYSHLHSYVVTFYIAAFQHFYVFCKSLLTSEMYSCLQTDNPVMKTLMCSLSVCKILKGLTMQSITPSKCKENSSLPCPSGKLPTSCTYAGQDFLTALVPKINFFQQNHLVPDPRQRYTHIQKLNYVTWQSQTGQQRWKEFTSYLLKLIALMFNSSFSCDIVSDGILPFSLLQRRTFDRDGRKFPLARSSRSEQKFFLKCTLRRSHQNRNLALIL